MGRTSSVASILNGLLDETRAANESVLLAFETADPTLLSVPFEAARLPGGRLPDRADYQRDLFVSYSKSGDSLRTLRNNKLAKTFYNNSLRIIKRLAKEEPNRADYQVDLSASYDRIGDLLRELGQTEQAKSFYKKSLRISERLTADDPNHADYRRNLSFSYDRMGVILRVLGQSEQAKTFYENSLHINERLAINDPHRADYQTQLVTTLTRMAEFAPEGSRSLLLRALCILESLKSRGALLPTYEPWITWLQYQLENP